MTLRLEPFTRGELTRIHGATVRILEGTGIRVLEPEAANLLEAAGGSWDRSTNIVKIPEAVLKELIMRAPSRFKLYGRDPDHVLSFGEGNVYMSTMGTAVQVEDPLGTVRPATLKDVENFYRLSDSLACMDHASWIVWPRDVPDPLVHIYEVLYGFRAAGVGGYRQGLAAGCSDGCGDGVQPFLFAAGQHHASSRRGIGGGDGCADPARGAGDQGDFVGEVKGSG